MRFVLPVVPLLLVLGSCGSPPKPPKVDESTRRPVNLAVAVDLQICKGELQNTRILANESGRMAAHATATLERVAAGQKAIAALQAALPVASTSNAVFTIHFGFGSTHVVVPPEVATSLIESARTAPLVLLRGRTDGVSDSPVESRIARERAAAVRAYLVSAGVDPTRIRATYQPTGDHAADNSNPTGQGMNRRVEIEVYRALPVAMGSSAADMP
jgi:outer membrane protein OmpA-like peptidoglycan-associated protein